MSIPVFRYTDSGFAARCAALRDKLRGGGLVATGTGQVDVRAAVAEILTDVRQRGDRALVDWERKLDGAKLTPATLRVPSDRVAAAVASAGAAFLALVRRVADNIRQYQQSILAQAPAPLRRGGRELSVRYTPIDRVAVYVPGRQAIYPSTVLMTVVPAQVAGVKEIALCSPPSAKGEMNELVLVLAGALGVTEVYRLGGAQAVGAMAFGTETIRAVDKIVG
ncbi:MAG: histidinol dehydrogenase, partial [Phycisphaerae bacterium]|nr:histidinol dehydrogenase [Phycisphaerae bacterium]